MVLRLSTLALAVSAAALLSAPSSAAELKQSLQGAKLELDNIVGRVTVNVTPGATGIDVTLNGDDEMVQRVYFEQTNGEVVIGMREDEAMITLGSSDDRLAITISVAPGTPLEIDGFVGTATVGDLDAPVKISADAGSVTVGRVADASIEIDGSADVSLGEVRGKLDVETSGSGTLKAGAAGATSIEIYGSGDADVAAVRGALKIETSGSADVMIGRVDGPTQIETSGSGDVKIRGGSANPFAASTSGSGDVVFAGTAVNPQVATSGSGEICIGSAEGAIALSGARVKIGGAACDAS